LKIPIRYRCDNYRRKLQGHPDLKRPVFEGWGGSLGIGLTYSIGNALAAKLDQKETHIFTVRGEGESDEGQVGEAAMTAAKYKVDNLTLILDRNFIQQESYTEKIMPLDESLDGDELPEMWKDASRRKTGDKWAPCGGKVIEVDGHRIEQISEALDRAKSVKGMPSNIIARTIKGKAVEHMEDNPQWQGKAPNPALGPGINQE
jgi:Transketolase, N-terminal subunit